MVCYRILLLNLRRRYEIRDKRLAHIFSRQLALRHSFPSLTGNLYNRGSRLDSIISPLNASDGSAGTLATKKLSAILYTLFINTAFHFKI